MCPRNDNGSRIFFHDKTTNFLRVYLVSTDSSDNIFVVGSGGSPGDIYLWKYSSSGTKIWTQVSSSTSDDGGNGGITIISIIITIFTIFYCY